MAGVYSARIRSKIDIARLCCTGHDPVLCHPMNITKVREGRVRAVRVPMEQPHQTAGCPILARSVRKGGIPQLSNPRDFDRPMPCQTLTAPTSVESHPFDSAQRRL